MRTQTYRIHGEEYVFEGDKNSKKCRIRWNVYDEYSCKESSDIIFEGSYDECCYYLAEMAF